MKCECWEIDCVKLNGCMKTDWPRKSLHHTKAIVSRTTNSGLATTPHKNTDTSFRKANQIKARMLFDKSESQETKLLGRALGGSSKSCQA